MASLAETWVQDTTDRGLFQVRTDVLRDPLIFDAERSMILDRSWLYVGHTSEVPQSGDFLTRSVGGHPVIMTCDGEGEVHVLFNTCAHQGVQVCRVPRGHAAAFQCFFHGWVYGLDGQLENMPGAGGYQGAFDPRLHRLARPRYESYRGFVFMCSDPNTPSLSEYLGPAKTYFDYVADQDDEMVVIEGCQKYVTHGNWKMVTMNSNDGYHVATTHATYLRYLRDMGVDTSQRKLGRRPDHGNGHTGSEFFGGWGRPIARWAVYWPEHLKAELADKKARLVRDHGAEKAELMAEVDRNLIVFPNLVINDHSAIIIRTWEPLAADKVVVSSWMLGPREESEELRRLRLKNFLTFFGPAGFSTPDDIEALEAAQRGFRNSAPEWLDVSKGAMGQPDTVNNADEIQLRAFWRQWQRCMSVDEPFEALA